MRLVSSMSFLATAATCTHFLAPADFANAGIPGVCEAPSSPVELVAEPNVPLRLSCGKDFPELVPLDGQAFAVTADGTCGATLVDDKRVQVAIRPMPSSEPASAGDSMDYLVDFINYTDEEATKICFRCVSSPDAASTSSGTAQDACVIYVTVKLTTPMASSVNSTSVPGTAKESAVSVGEQKTEENKENEVSREDEIIQDTVVSEQASTPVDESQTRVDESPIDGEVGKDTKEIQISAAGGTLICDKEEQKLTLSPGQQATFGCGPSMELNPETHENVLLAGSEMKCSGIPVSLQAVLPGASLSSETVNQKDVYTFKAGPDPPEKEQHLCYLCLATREGQGNNVCRMLITIPSHGSSLTAPVVLLGVTSIVATFLTFTF